MATDQLASGEHPHLAAAARAAALSWSGVRGGRAESIPEEWRQLWRGHAASVASLPAEQYLGEVVIWRTCSGHPVVVDQW